MIVVGWASSDSRAGDHDLNERKEVQCSRGISRSESRTVLLEEDTSNEECKAGIVPSPAIADVIVGSK